MMTDIDKMLKRHGMYDTVIAMFEAKDMEIERLRTENQELKLQYLSDQGQWIEETGRLREALREKES